MNDDVALKKFKRRREDDFDIATIKRRAVSPGVSAQNSPVLTASPSQRDAGPSIWGLPPDRKDKDKNPSLSEPSSQLTSVRSNSGGSVASTSASGSVLASQGRKLGLQGMVDTNDGLMKMCIE